MSSSIADTLDLILVIHWQNSSAFKSTRTCKSQCSCFDWMKTHWSALHSVSLCLPLAGAKNRWSIIIKLDWSKHVPCKHGSQVKGNMHLEITIRVPVLIVNHINLWSQHRLDVWPSSKVTTKPTTIDMKLDFFRGKNWGGLGAPDDSSNQICNAQPWLPSYLAKERKKP